MDEDIVYDVETAEEDPGFQIATVGAVTGNGLKLIFEGESEASDKEYHCNNAVRFAAGDRVKITRDSGTYIVDFPIGTPMERFPIPGGGSDGQVLVKNGDSPYQVEWRSFNSVPESGTSGYVLTKTANGYGWENRGIPTGGTANQVLAKTGAGDFAVSWRTIDTLPSTTGVTTGYVLTKTASGIAWQAAPSPEVNSLVNGNYTLNLSNGGVLASSASNRKIALGTQSIPFNNCYFGGNIMVGTSSSDKIGFFGHAVASRQTISNSATVATLITALKAYGLIA